MDRKERDAKLRALLEQAELWLFPFSFVALGLALAFLWYANSEWRAASRPAQVVEAEMTPLPEPSSQRRVPAP